MKTVAVDIRANHNTGVARYGRSLLHEIGPIAAQYSLKLVACLGPEESEDFSNLAQYGHEVVTIPSQHGFIRNSPELRALLLKSKVDLLYSSHYLVDRLCPVPFSFTIHDLTRWKYPHLSYNDASFAARFGEEELTTLKRELRSLPDFDERDTSSSLFTQYFKAMTRDLVSRSERIVTVSTSSGMDILSLLPSSAGKIDCVPGGVDRSVFYPRPGEEIRLVRTRLGLDQGPYLVFVGLTHKHKRFEWLVEQLERGKSRFPDGVKLAVIGGYAEQSRRARVIEGNDDSELVVFTGRLSDSELAALYSGSAGWISASISEGYGLPALEAHSCGSNVIVTDIPVFRETTRGFGHFYPPHDGSALVDLANLALRGALPKQKLRADLPSWHISGQLLVQSLLHSIEGLQSGG